jgi:hypothetical protein
MAGFPLDVLDMLDETKRAAIREGKAWLQIEVVDGQFKYTVLVAEPKDEI